MDTKINLKNKKKGFTLIELLAVIIIIALVSLITIPVITATIENAKKKAFTDSVMLTSREIDNYLIKNDDFGFNEGEKISVDQLKSVAKNNFKSGYYIVKDGKLEAYFISDGTYCALGPVTNLQVNKDCTKLDNTESEIDKNKLIVTSTSNSISVTIAEGFAKDLESGIKEYQISLKNTNKSETITEEGTVNFNGLETGTYTVVVDVINNNDIGLKEKIEKEISTKEIDTPTYTVSPSGFAQSKTVTIDFKDSSNQYTHEYSIDSGRTFETYTKPIQFNNNGSVIARVNDGVNYVTSSSQTVSGIDLSRPTSASFTYETTTDSITVTAIGVDNDSQITHYQFSRDNGTTWTNVQTSSTYTFSNLNTGKYSIKVRVINGTYSNVGSINDKNYLDSEKQDIVTAPSEKPTYTVSPSGWSHNKTVTIDFKDTNNLYTHEYSLDSGSTWSTYTKELTLTTNGTIIAKVSDTNGNYVQGTSETISTIDRSAPTASVTLKEKTSKSITVTASGTDEESHIYGYQYSKDNGSTWTSITSNTEYTFEDLPTDTYTIKVRAINNTYTNEGINNLSSTISSELVVPTETIDEPTFVVSPSGWSQSKTVTILYPEGYTNTYSTDGARTWQTYTGAITLTTNGSIIAKSSDGLNYVTGTSEAITTIDRSAPTAASVTKKTTTSKSITVTASGSDSESDIYGYQFSSDNGTTWTNVQTSNEYTFSNLATGTYQIKVKVINNTYGNEGINENNSLVSSANAITTNEIPIPTYEASPDTTYAQSKTVTIDYHDTNNTYTHQYSLNGGTSWQTYTESIVFNENGTVIARITDGKNYVSGSSYSVSGIDTTEPSATASIGAKTTSTVVVNATCADNESGITKIEYSNGGSWIDNGTEEHYKFTNLTAGTSYNFKVRCTNGSLLTKESAVATGQTGSASIAFNPTRTPSDTTYATSVSVPVTYTIANVTSPTRYIRTNVAGTKLNIAAVPCGTDTTPGTCGSTLNANTAMVKDTWYKVEENPTVTIAITTSSVTLTAVVHDGNAYLTSSTQAITNVDTSAPTVATASVGAKTTTTVVVNATCTDGDSGISKIEYSSDNGSTWTANGTTTNYRFTGLTEGTSYNFKVRCTNGAGSQTTSNATSGTTGSTDIAFAPTRTPSSTTWAKSVSVPVTYTTTNVTSPTRYIRTNVAGTKLNIAAVPCGTNSTPGTCSGTLAANTAMVKDTWYKVEENPTVTVAIDTTSVTLTAVIHDGNAYLTSETQAITNVDTSAPTTATVTKKSTTSKSITVTASGSDNISPITRYQFSKDNGATWEPTTPQTSNEYTFSNLTSGTYNIKSRVYNGTYEAGGTNNDNYVDSSANAIATGTLCTPTYSVSPDTTYAQSKSVTIALPSGCSGTLQYSLDSGTTFTNYSSAVSFTTNGTIVARVTDGLNYVTASSYTVSGIDTSEPELTLGTVTSTADTITIQITVNRDSQSMITNTVCSATANSTTTNGTISNNTCTISGLVAGTTYSYSVTTTNGANLSTTRSGSIDLLLTASMITYTNYGNTTAQTALDDLFNKTN